MVMAYDHKNTENLLIKFGGIVDFTLTAIYFYQNAIQLTKSIYRKTIVSIRTYSMVEKIILKVLEME